MLLLTPPRFVFALFLPFLFNLVSNRLLVGISSLITTNS